MTDGEALHGCERVATPDAYPLDDELLERAVLMEIINLHPTHPTLCELRLTLSNGGVLPERHALEDSLGLLKSFGLVRENGKIIEPTLAALHAAEVIIQRG